jgi:hypothetical protein
MSQINNITINIALNTLPLSQKGFGLPLIAGTKVRAGKPDYVEVSDADDLLDSSIGFVNTDPEYKMAQAIFSQSPRLDKIAVCYISSFADLATELAAYRNEGKDSWYYLLITSREKADIAIADTYINSLKKIGVFASDDQTIASSGERTFILITNHNDEYPDAAIVGRCAGEQVGQVSWDSKQLNGISNSDVTLSEQSALLAANFNLIREMGGVNVTWEGKLMGGQYIDSVISRDYLEARFTEALQSLKINNKKIPFDQRGIGMTEAALRRVFDEAGVNGVIRPVLAEEDRQYSDLGKYQYVLTLPASVNDISPANRANRVIAPIVFTAKLSGSINTFQINGSLEV